MVPRHVYQRFLFIESHDTFHETTIASLRLKLAMLE